MLIGRRLFSCADGSPVFTVFMNWTLARAGNTQRLKQLGGEDEVGIRYSFRLHPTRPGGDLEARVVGRDPER